DRLPGWLYAREARGACAGTAQGLGAAARDLAARNSRPARDPRPRRRPSLLRDLPDDALRRDRAHRLRGRRPRPLPDRRGRGVEGHAARPGPRDDLASPLDGAQGLLPAFRRPGATPELPELPASEV